MVGMQNHGCHCQTGRKLVQDAIHEVLGTDLRCNVSPTSLIILVLLFPRSVYRLSCNFGYRLCPDKAQEDAFGVFLIQNILKPDGYKCESFEYQ